MDCTAAGPSCLPSTTMTTGAATVAATVAAAAAAAAAAVATAVVTALVLNVYDQGCAAVARSIGRQQCRRLTARVRRRHRPSARR